ncbi:MAG: PepSY-associated TM helix domain-containing protein [Pseudomonadota bacterium]
MKAGREPAKKPKSNRKKLYALHSWLGFHLAAIMALVLFTGTFATISNEIDWLIQHDMRVSPDGEMVSWGEMERAILDYAPGHTIRSLSAMEGDHFAYRARVVDPYGRVNFVHVNQWTGEVTGETHLLTVQRVFRDLHRYLFMPNYIGLPLVTSLAFVLAISLYTGLKTTRNWRTIMFRVRTDKGTRILMGDAHKAAGLWGIWFFVVIIVTGVWYLIEFGVSIGYVVSKADLSELRPRLAQERVEAFGPVIKDRPLEEVVTAARAAYPELKITHIQYPSGATGLFGVQGMVGNPVIRERSNTVYLDPETLDVVSVRKWKESSLFYALNEMADPLHFGFFGGLPTKLIWFVFGAAMTGLSITGVWLTWKRLKTMQPSKTQYATMPVLLVSMLFCTAWYDRFQGPSIPAAETMLAETMLEGGVRAQLHVALDTIGEPTGLVRLTLESARGRVAVKEAVLTLNGETTGAERPRVFGRTSESRFEVAPDMLSNVSNVDIDVTFIGAHQRTASWALSGSDGARLVVSGLKTDPEPAL